MAKMIQTGGIRVLRSNKKFRQALAIREVGATPIFTRRGTLFKLGGGLFSKRAILASRRRFARVTYNNPKMKLNF